MGNAGSSGRMSASRFSPAKKTDPSGSSDAVPWRPRETVVFPSLVIEPSAGADRGTLAQGLPVKHEMIIGRDAGRGVGEAGGHPLVEVELAHLVRRLVGRTRAEGRREHGDGVIVIARARGFGRLCVRNRRCWLIVLPIIADRSSPIFR